MQHLSVYLYKNYVKNNKYLISCLESNEDNFCLLYGSREDQASYVSAIVLVQFSAALWSSLRTKTQDFTVPILESYQ